MPTGYNDPELNRQSMQAEFKRREELRRQRLEDALDSMREKSTRTPEEVAELRRRLERLEQLGNGVE
jgi:hypothetical protein